MSRSHVLRALLERERHPPAPGVWEMTLRILGAAFGVARVRRDEKTEPHR
jgi:hypothetical protein